MLWTRTIAAEHSQALHTSASPAAPTPVTDGRRVVAYFPSFGLIAFDRDGVELWRHPLPLLPIPFGTGTSPILVGDTVVLQRDGSSAAAELLALDAASGKVAWRAPRPLMGDSWSTPMVWRRRDADEIVTLGASKVVAYGLGRRGTLVGGRPAGAVDRVGRARRRRAVRQRVLCDRHTGEPVAGACLERAARASTTRTATASSRSRTCRPTCASCYGRRSRAGPTAVR